MAFFLTNFFGRIIWLIFAREIFLGIFLGWRLFLGRFFWKFILGRFVLGEFFWAYFLGVFFGGFFSNITWYSIMYTDTWHNCFVPDLLICSFCYLKYVMTQINAIPMLDTIVQKYTIKLLMIISQYKYQSHIHAALC